MISRHWYSLLLCTVWCSSIGTTVSVMFYSIIFALKVKSTWKDLLCFHTDLQNCECFQKHTQYPSLSSCVSLPLFQSLSLLLPLLMYIFAPWGFPVLPILFKYNILAKSYQPIWSLIKEIANIVLHSHWQGPKSHFCVSACKIIKSPKHREHRVSMK